MTEGDGATDPVVIAFGELIDLEPSAQRRALERIRLDHPAVADAVTRLLRHAGARTRILTSFAAEPHASPRRVFTPGETIGGFALLERIGQGGMGEVWRARQLQPARDVALKLILATGSASTRVAALREPETLAMLRHPSIATIHASGHDDSLTWIAMEFVANASTITEAARTRTLRERIGLLLIAADAIAHAHAAGFIHRDLKPSNILVDADGRVKVIDFGIALPPTTDRVADPRGACGTPAYIAPESLDPSTAQVDARADVRALGVLLYEIVHGALPESLRSEHPIELLRAIRDERFAPPAGATREIRRESRRETTGDLAAIIAHATAAEPGSRYPTVAAFASDLRAFLAHRPVDAARPGSIARLRLAARRNPIAATLAVGVFATLVAATAVSTYYALYARRAAIEAGALATRTNSIYNAFLDIFLPGDMAMQEIRSLTVEQYLRTRVDKLEDLAAKSMPRHELVGKTALPITLQFACRSLGLKEESARCEIAREILEARLDDPKGLIAAARHLDALYARLSRDPGDSAARAAIESLVPKMLGQTRLFSAEPLSAIATVDYFGNPIMTAQVAEILIKAAPDNPEVVLSAISRLALDARRSIQRAERLDEERLHNLARSVRLLDQIAEHPDPGVRNLAVPVASGINALFSSDLPVVRNPELIPMLIEVSLIENRLNPQRRPLMPHLVKLNYFDVTPLRLARAGEWDLCRAALHELDRIVRERGLTIDPSANRNLAVARAELALHRASVEESAMEPSGGRLEALAVLDQALGVDAEADYLYRSDVSFALALDRHASIAAELGRRDLLERDLAHATRYIEAMTDPRAPTPLILGVQERIAELLQATEHLPAS